MAVVLLMPENVHSCPLFENLTVYSFCAHSFMVRRQRHVGRGFQMSRSEPWGTRPDFVTWNLVLEYRCGVGSHIATFDVCLNGLDPTR